MVSEPEVTLFGLSNPPSTFMWIIIGLDLGRMFVDLLSDAMFVRWPRVKYKIPAFTLHYFPIASWEDIGMMCWVFSGANKVWIVYLLWLQVFRNGTFHACRKTLGASLIAHLYFKEVVK